MLEMHVNNYFAVLDRNFTRFLPSFFADLFLFLSLPPTTDFTSLHITLRQLASPIHLSLTDCIAQESSAGRLASSSHITLNPAFVTHHTFPLPPVCKHSSSSLSALEPCLVSLITYTRVRVTEKHQSLIAVRLAPLAQESDAESVTGDEKKDDPSDTVMKDEGGDEEDDDDDEEEEVYVHTGLIMVGNDHPDRTCTAM